MTTDGHIAPQQSHSTVYPEKRSKGRCPEPFENQWPGLGLFVIAVGVIRGKLNGICKMAGSSNLLTRPGSTHGNDPEQDDGCVHEQKCSDPAMDMR